MLLNADGSIDVEGTAAALNSLGVKVYAYLININTSQTYLTALDPFLAAIARYDMEVILYLVPPPEASPQVKGQPVNCTRPNYPPHQLDYVAWAQEAANLKVKYPKQMLGLAIDDLIYSSQLNPDPSYHAACGLFTAGYIHQMVQAAHVITAKAGVADLTFFPLIYYYKPEYKSVYPIWPDSGGILFAYHGPQDDTINTDAFTPQVTEIAQRYSCHDDYRTPNRGFPSYRQCVSLYFPGGAYGTLKAGDWNGFWQTVTPGKTAPTLDFYVHGNYDGGSGEVTVELDTRKPGGTWSVLWSTDIAQLGRDWASAHVIVPGTVSGKAIELGWFVRNKVGGQGQWVLIDGISAKGITLANPGFAAGHTGWNVGQTNPLAQFQVVKTLPLIPMIYTRQRRVPGNPTELQPPPTADYVADLIDITVNSSPGRPSLAEQGLADGIMPYGIYLDPSKDPQGIYPATQAAYRRFVWP
jgi:hypothetical protein